MGALKSILKQMTDEVRDYLLELTRSLAEEQEAQAHILRLPAGKTLLRAQDDAVSVYILLMGEVEALKEQENGVVYAFAKFKAPDLFGEFEAFAESCSYRSTLFCITNCMLAVLPREVYLAWMRSDAEVLFQRTQHITRQLVHQAGAERNFFFYTGVQRFRVYLSQMWETEQKNGVLRLRATRSQMADETGFCVKTIQRALNSLREQGLLTLEGRTIVIDEEQYRKL